MIDNNKKYHVLIHTVLLLLVAFCILPFILLVVASFTDEQVLIRNGYSFIPSKVNFDAYRYLFRSSTKIFRGYIQTIIVTIVGTTVSILVTAMFSYALSRKEMIGRNILSFIVFFTMLFNGGVVPQYIMWTQLFHVKDTIWALIIPNLLMNAFYVIMMRSYFTQSVPEALIEAARIDGSGEFKTFFKIVMPISKPIIATVGLMVGLGYWNDWINGLYYITDTTKYTIQNILNRMLQDAQFISSGVSVANVSDLMKAVPSNGIRMAVAVVGVLPILIIYPFVQRYLVQGITIGAVKG